MHLSDAALVIVLLVIVFLAAAPLAQDAISAEELAKLAPNPFGNLFGAPFQSNINLNVGPEKGTQNIPNIHNVEKPDCGANSQVRIQAQLMFPKQGALS